MILVNHIPYPSIFKNRNQAITKRESSDELLTPSIFRFTTDITLTTYFPRHRTTNKSKIIPLKITIKITHKTCLPDKEQLPRSSSPSQMMTLSSMSTVPVLSRNGERTRPFLCLMSCLDSRSFAHTS